VDMVAISPDSKKIAYSDGPWDQNDLFLVNIDGTNRTRLRDLLK
jgi:Tol biopolymer transport system component